MKYKSQLITQATGSLGGITFSHNRGGLYMRSRAIPTNPNSPQQQAVRAYLGALQSLWKDTLTPAQRDAWAVYAANTFQFDPLGNPVLIPPNAQYSRSNTPRLQASLPRVDDGPTNFNRGDFTAPTFAFAAATGILSVTFTNTDDWANEDDAAMLVFTGREQNPSINFFKGPYRFAGKIDGDGVTPPTSPAAITAAFPCAAGNRCFVRVIVTRADGRLSLPFRGFSLAA